MIVLTVVTAPRAGKGRLTPLEGWVRLVKGLPNLYLGTELPRGSVRAVARTGQGWVKMFRLSALRRLEARRATVSDSVYSAGSDAGGHKPCSALLGRTRHRRRDLSGPDGPYQKPARVRFSRLASQKCGRAAFQSWCQPAKANTLLGRRRPAPRSPYPGETQLPASGPKKTVAPEGRPYRVCRTKARTLQLRCNCRGGKNQ